MSYLLVLQTILVSHGEIKGYDNLLLPSLQVCLEVRTVLVKRGIGARCIVKREIE